MKLSDLCGVYIYQLQSTPYSNPSYRSENLKTKLLKSEKYKDKLAFCPLGSFHTDLVYNANISTNDAIRFSFNLGTLDMLKEAGTFIRKAILDSFDNSDDLPWPPTTEYLHSRNIIPDQLQKFLEYVLTGKSGYHSTKTHRLIYSIGQDVCRAATNGKWKMPKHILICMTLHHLFRSKEMITLMNRFGHSESHSFALELETAIARSMDETSSVLTNQIVRNPTAPSVFHSEFDNFDQFVNDIQGKGSIHTAHGIMLQDIIGDPSCHGGTVPIQEPSTRKGNSERSLNIELTENLPDAYVTQRKSPQMDIVQHKYPEGANELESAVRTNMIWILIRKHCASTGQEVPSWAGFVSATGGVPDNLTTLDYYPIIYHPITNYSTVQECLRIAENATREVGQEYTLTTFDLGVCMKAFPLIWNYPTKYKKHVVLMGSFYNNKQFLYSAKSRCDCS